MYYFFFFTLSCLWKKERFLFFFFANYIISDGLWSLEQIRLTGGRGGGGSLEYSFGRLGDLSVWIGITGCSFRDLIQYEND